MKGFKIIPLFLFLIVLAYLGVMFVEANRDEVLIHFGNNQVGPSALGFVILTSVLFGMLAAALLCSVELLFLYVQNKKLKRKLAAAARINAGLTRSAAATSPVEPSDLAPASNTIVRQP